MTEPEPEKPDPEKPELRKQYAFRPSPDGLQAWDVHRLIELAAELPTRDVALADIREIDENYWYAPEDPPPTCRSVLGHAELILRADLRYPVILASDGSVMDGMHRILKALMDGRDVIRAVQFATDPEPDFVGRAPAELPY